LAATYDPTLPTDKDYVRFLVPDTDVSPATDATFSDEEITAVIAEQTAKGRTGASTKYFATWQLLGIQLSTLASAGGGRKEKEVDDLRIGWGMDAGSADSLRERRSSMWAEGVRCLVPRPILMKAYGRVTA
jgi:hypothetical protein